jgi:hypothetical protein
MKIRKAAYMNLDEYDSRIALFSEEAFQHGIHFNAKVRISLFSFFTSLTSEEGIPPCERKQGHQERRKRLNGNVKCAIQFKTSFRCSQNFVPASASSSS